MGLLEPVYPDNVWDGLSDNIDRTNRLNNVDPNSQDYDRIAAETIGIEEEIDRIKVFAEMQSQEVTSNTTLDATSEFVLVDASAGSVVITLPDAADSNRCTKEIKKVDSSAFTVTVVPAGSDTIDGESEVIIGFQWTTLTIQSVEGAWYIR